MIFQTMEEMEHWPSVYAKMAKAEKRYDKLLTYCKKYPVTIFEHYADLVEDCLEEVAQIFQRCIFHEAELARNRSEYKTVCEQIDVYHQACGGTGTEYLLASLKEKYKRKPAFLDELEKVEKKL